MILNLVDRMTAHTLVCGIRIHGAEIHLANLVNPENLVTGFRRFSGLTGCR
jgi:hypothetical protein